MNTKATVSLGLAITLSPCALRAQDTPQQAPQQVPNAAMSVTPQHRMPLKWRLFTSGATILSTIYMLNVLSAAAIADPDGHYRALYVPVLGPFIQMGSPRSTREIDRVFLGFDGLFQAAGAGLLIAAICMREPRGREVQLTPIVTPGALGLGLSGRF